MQQPNQRMPVLFIGHGSPLNLVKANKFTKSLAKLGKSTEAYSDYGDLSALVDARNLCHMYGKTENDL